MGEHGKFNSIQGESGMDWLEITDDVLRHKPFPEPIKAPRCGTVTI